MKKKPYSFLDQRRTDFDQDYDEFCKHTNELHVSHTITHRQKGVFAMLRSSQGFVHFIVSFSPPQNQLKTFMDTTLDKIQNTERALSVLKTFER